MSRTPATNTIKTTKLTKTTKNSHSSPLLSHIERNQVYYSGWLLTVLFTTHYFFPFLRRYTAPFFQLQYKLGDNEYVIGAEDGYMILYWIVVLTFLRSFTMKYLWHPLANKMLPPKSKNHLRFSEQCWAALAPILSFAYSFYIYINSEYRYDLDYVYLNWPHNKLSPSMKIYYLLEAAYWFQQIFVLHVEKRRKDHYQMFTHHILTCSLIMGSYYYHFTRIGNVILLLMDPVDFFLSFAKTLRYVGYLKACDICFILFLVSWVVLRHGFYNYVFYHTWTKAAILTKDSQCRPGVYENTCWTPTVFNVFYELLGGLQVLQIIWLYFIIKVAIKVITGSGAEDVRSDSEDSESELEIEEYNDNDDRESDESVDDAIDEKSNEKL